MRGLINKYIFLFLVLIVLPFRLYNFTQPLLDITAFRQAQTATVALNFYKNGINFLQTELDILGMGKERFLTLEFPFYQAVIAILYKLFFVSDMWGKTVSIIAGFIGGWYLHRLIILVFNHKKLALFSTFFYFFAPLNMYHQRDFLIESTVVCFLLAGIYYSCFWIKRQNRRNLFLAIILLSLGFIQKGMYGPFWLIPIVFYYLKLHPIKSKNSLKLLLVLGIPLITLFLWQSHVNYVNTIHGHSYFTTANRDQLIWNLGTLDDRFSSDLWHFRIANLLNGIFLKPGFIIFLIGFYSFWKQKLSGFAYWWIIAEAIYFLTFFKIQSHIYYQMVIIPAISIFFGWGIIKIAQVLDFLRLKALKLSILVLFLVLFIYKSWLNSLWDKAIDWNWYRRIQKVGEAAPKDSWGIFVNPSYDWSSVYSYYPKLKLWSISVDDVSEDNLTNWKKSGYSYAILHRYKEYKKDLPLLLNKYKEVLTLEDFKVYIL